MCYNNYRKKRKGIKKMVGIFKYAGGLQFVAVSESEETAKRALYEKFLKENLYSYQKFPWNFQTTEELREYYPIEKWWENNQSYVIKEVEVL